MLDMFNKFTADKEAWEMYITGPAGTGKTTSLATLVERCTEQDLSYMVCAFTHRACNILRSKLPQSSNVATLHSFLKKRPGINEHATRKQQISVNKVQGKSDQVDVLFIDEFSMTGEKDYMDLGFVQDPDYEGVCRTKIIYIGDLNQLPPVGDTLAINPKKPYWHKLTKIYRTDGGLLAPLAQLVTFIEGTQPVEELITNEDFVRGVDIVDMYKNSAYLNGVDAVVLLAYTNERVEVLNAAIAGKNLPDTADNLFSPTLRQNYKFYPSNKEVTYITTINGNALELNSKYKTLEHLITMSNEFEQLSFALLMDKEEDEEYQFAYVFGHYQYKITLDDLMQKAADSNAVIEKQFGMSAKTWAGMHKHDPLARKRAKAWRDYLCFKECVICLDFPYAMTVHKSQGSTYDYVFIDTEDLNKAAQYDYTTYLKLLYVAISRASKRVFTN